MGIRMFIVKKEKEETQAKLTKANEQLAVNENSLKNVVHATLCANPPENTGAKGASPFLKSWSKFVHELWNLGCENHDIYNLCFHPALEQLITKGLKVEVKGNEKGVNFNWSAKAKERGVLLKSHAARIVAVRGDGQYEVEFDHVVDDGTKGYKPHFRTTLRATQFRIL